MLNLLGQELTSSIKGLYFKTLKMPWWVEIKTTIPVCIYYFGPFYRKKVAQSSQHGYIEDLIQERACGITVEIKRLQPKVLTVYED
jgi:Domain of unknown function (DUF1816)